MTLYILLLTVAVLPVVVAQIGNEALCVDSNYNWAFNRLGQSPCHVGAVLTHPCPPGLFPEPLPSGNVYVGPTSDQVSNCTCNSIYYSLICACSACQDRGFVPWSTFSTNCNQTFFNYPNIIPNDTSVPHWAYLNVSVNDTFDLSLASTAGGDDSTAPPTATSTSASASTSTSWTLTSFVSTSSTPTSTSSPSGSSETSARVIAGGVAASFIGGVLIMALTFWIYMWCRSRRTGTSVWTSVQEIPPPFSNVTTVPMYQLPQNPYNPDDPSTFPPPRNEFTQENRNEFTQENTIHRVETARGYNGMPEL